VFLHGMEKLFRAVLIKMRSIKWATLIIHHLKTLGNRRSTLIFEAKFCAIDDKSKFVKTAQKAHKFGLNLKFLLKGVEISPILAAYIVK